MTKFLRKVEGYISIPPNFVMNRNLYQEEWYSRTHRPLYAPVFLSV